MELVAKIVLKNYARKRGACAQYKNERSRFVA